MGRGMPDFTRRYWNSNGPKIPHCDWDPRLPGIRRGGIRASVAPKSLGDGKRMAKQLRKWTVLTALALLASSCHMPGLAPLGTSVTPLGTAASEAHIKVVKALLKAGADPSQRLGGGIGKNSAELALEKNHMDVISAMTRADMAANPRRYSAETN